MKFGVREICNVTFKAAAQNQKIGNTIFDQYQPVFMIDTAQTSEMSQESTTVYAQGGRGYNRLIAWEGEKTMTFTVTDALMSPMGLAVLSGAGLVNAEKGKKDVHVHITLTVSTDASGKAKVYYNTIADEVGITDKSTIHICQDGNTPIYATVVDGSNDITKWLDKEAVSLNKNEVEYTDENSDYIEFTITGAESSKVNLDAYVIMQSGAFEITIAPEDFGGYFYVEADTLFRREDTGVDMAATLTFPRVKVQSGFTFSMAASGDPSTFDFTMDAFPGNTRFDATKKVCVTMAIVEGSGESGNSKYHSSELHSI